MEDISQQQHTSWSGQEHRHINDLSPGVNQDPMHFIHELYIRCAYILPMWTGLNEFFCRSEVIKKTAGTMKGIQNSQTNKYEIGRLNTSREQTALW